jgi:hypothetical protein
MRYVFFFSVVSAFRLLYVSFKMQMSCNSIQRPNFSISVFCYHTIKDRYYGFKSYSEQKSSGFQFFLLRKFHEDLKVSYDVIQ